MNKKLFDIRTTVYFATDTRVATIIAPKEIRSRIWNIVINDWFNPGVARFDGKTPTSMTLKPYPGYEDSDLVAQMAEAAACFALVEDFTVLFDKNVFDVLDNGIAPRAENFAIDRVIIAQFQQRYVSYMATKTLQSQVHDLSFQGINYAAIRQWYNEAVEAFRRLQFTSNVIDDKIHLAQFDIAVQNLDRVTRIESAAQTMRQTQTHIRQDLEKKIDAFATAIMENGPTKLLHNIFTEIGFSLETERDRLQRDVKGFTQSWITIQTAMDQIRRMTPPEPPAPKK